MPRIGRVRGSALILVSVAVLWGGTWPAGKLAAAHVAPATVAVVRFALACALLWLWARLRGARPGLPGRADVPLVLVLGASAVFGYNLFFLYGLRLAPAADGSILVPGLIPILTTLLAWPVLGDRPPLRAALGFAVALAGLVLVVDPVGGFGTRRLQGDALLVGAALCWPWYTLAARRATARFGTIAANLYATGAGCLLLLPVSFLPGGGWSALAHASAGAWASIVYLGVFGTMLSFVLFFEGVRAVGASRASAYTLLVPIFGVLFSVLVLGERLRPTLAAGGAVVLAGLALVQGRSRLRPTRRHEPGPGDGPPDLAVAD